MSVFAHQSKPVAITCGDPAGVGPEVVVGALESIGAAAVGVCLVGPRAWAEPLAARFGCGYEGVGAAGFSAVPGEPSEAGAAVALEALELAAAGCTAGRFAAVVTGPVSKAWMQRAGFRWPGQTEFFAERWAGEPTMAFVGEALRVVLTTWHIPLSAVPAAVDAASLTLAVERAAWLAGRLGCAEPRIGVCGLNPHAGEGGLLGSEERDRLDPVLDGLRERYPQLSCCLPGDTVFARQRRGDFDVVIAQYHDQGLAAVKTLEFDRAVNLTLGLDHLRTSPDHGTAFDIAGNGVADCGSMRAAIELAPRVAG